MRFSPTKQSREVLRSPRVSSLHATPSGHGSQWTVYVPPALIPARRSSLSLHLQTLFFNFSPYPRGCSWRHGPCPGWAVVPTAYSASMFLLDQPKPPSV